MRAVPTDADLREAARHRGFRLVKSRVKTPAKGDYGKFGLVDAKGDPVFGHGDKALTASAQDIADFLRKGEALTWAASVDTKPQIAPLPRKARRTEDEEIEPLLRPRARKRYRPPEDDDVLPARRTRPKFAEPDFADDVARRAALAPLRKKRAMLEEPSPERANRTSKRPPLPVLERPTPELEPAPKPSPMLKIRTASRDDAEDIAALVALIPGDGDSASIAEQLRAKRGSGVLVADKGAVIGVVAWSIVPTLQRGPVGRITAIVVAEGERRSRVGRALLEDAIAAMKTDGARLIEAVSDIEIRNSHRFFRDSGFEQTSYRFARQA